MLRALLFRRSDVPQTIEIACEGAPLRVEVRSHPNARRYTLRIRATTREAVVTMPSRGSLRQARIFAQSHAAWIAARLSRLPDSVAFADGVSIPLRGEPHRIAHRPQARGTVWLDTDADGQPIVCVAGEAPHVERRVLDFLKREARRDLTAASRRAAAALGVTVARVSVRDQVSRWGSCSSTGAIAYSWRLVMAPPHVLDYLAAHEVAHLVEMNHSAAFWNLVARLCPDMARAKAWLDLHGAGLHRYGRPPRAALA